mgnify:CR=1 FL=1
MRQIIIFLCSIITSLLIISVAYTTPLYYTFEGNITKIQDGAGIVADAGLSLGDDVSYKFLFDFDRQGEYVQNNGTIVPVGGTFYVDLISGSLIDEKDGGFFNEDKDPYELNYGWDSTGRLLSNLFDNRTDIESEILGVRVSSWSVGDRVYGQEAAYDSVGVSSVVKSHLTLTSISVPEPSSLLSLCIGFFSIVAFKRQKQ